MKRRQILISAAGAALVSLVPLGRLSGPARAQDMAIHADDRILGAADAPITMIEYSSLTCPHCATFHRETLPRIKENWIDDGKVRLVFRHYPLDGLALRAAAIGNCIPGKRFFAFMGILFKNQRKWARAQDPLTALGQYARLAGLSQEQADACLADRAAMDKILQGAQEGRAVYGVESTPTFIVNGKKLSGALPYDEFESVFRDILPDA